MPAYLGIYVIYTRDCPGIAWTIVLFCFFIWYSLRCLRRKSRYSGTGTRQMVVVVSIQPHGFFDDLPHNDDQFDFGL